MKKIAIMLFASATVFLASCGNGAEKAETSTDSTVVTVDSTATTVDSTTVDSTKAVK
jgi:hypothetical protein